MWNLIQLFPKDLLEQRRVTKRLRKDLVVGDEYLKTGRMLQASDLWKRLTSSGDSLEDLDREVRAVIGTDPTAVVVNGSDNLCAVVQLLNQYSHEILAVNGILHHLQLTNAGYLHISREARRYSTFEIGIEDLVIVALNMHYMHFIGLRSAGLRLANDDVERIERILGGYRYPIERDAEHI